jgi:hypothetical protein
VSFVVTAFATAKAREGESAHSPRFFQKGFHAPQKADGRKLEDVQESRADARFFS